MERKDLLKKFKDFTAEKSRLEKKTYKYEINQTCMQLGKIQGMQMPAIKTAFCVIDEMTSINDKVINELDINVKLFTNAEKEEYSTFEGFTRDQWITDLKTRVAEIQDARRLENIDKAIPLIEKWLSDDDLFDLDMEQVEKLLNSI